MSASTPSRRGLQGVRWKFMAEGASKPESEGTGSPAAAASSSSASSALRTGGASVISDHSDTAAFIQKARAVRGQGSAASAAVGMEGPEGVGSTASAAAPTATSTRVTPLADAYMSTEKLLQSIVSDLEAYPTALQGLNKHLQGGSGGGGGGSTPLGRSSVPSAAVAAAIPVERPTTVSSTVEEPTEPPIVWRSESMGSGTLFPASLELSRSVKTAAPTPMRFGKKKYPPGTTRNRNQYGSAWFIPASRWTAEAGPDGATSKAPVTEEVKRAQEEQDKINRRFEKAQHQLSNLEISRKLAGFCRHKYGRTPSCLTKIVPPSAMATPSPYPTHSSADDGASSVPGSPASRSPVSPPDSPVRGDA